MNPRKVAALVLLSGATLLGTSSPSGAQLPGRPRQVNYRLKDNMYEPSSTLKIKKGETITFTFTNAGKVLHEAEIGTVATQAAHEKEMLAKGAVAMPDTKDRVTMKPGQSKSITIKFDKAGAFQIACHQPNHYQLGMKVPVVVS